MSHFSIARCSACRPFSDTYGRRLALLCTFTIFISACIGLALIRHYYQLVILRCLQSFGSASTIAIGSGMLGDITDRNNRGGYMGVFQTGLLMPLGELSPLWVCRRAEASYRPRSRWYICRDPRLEIDFLVSRHIRRRVPHHNRVHAARDTAKHRR